MQLKLKQSQQCEIEFFYKSEADSRDPLPHWWGDFSCVEFHGVWGLMGQIGYLRLEQPFLSYGLHKPFRPLSWNLIGSIERTKKLRANEHSFAALFSTNICSALYSLSPSPLVRFVFLLERILTWYPCFCLLFLFFYWFTSLIDSITIWFLCEIMNFHLVLLVLLCSSRQAFLNQCIHLKEVVFLYWWCGNNDSQFPDEPN